MTHDLVVIISNDRNMQENCKQVFERRYDVAFLTSSWRGVPPLDLSARYVIVDLTTCEVDKDIKFIEGIRQSYASARIFVYVKDRQHAAHLRDCRGVHVLLPPVIASHLLVLMQAPYSPLR